MRFQSAFALPECICASRVHLRFQSAFALPECICASRVHLRFQSAFALPECICFWGCNDSNCVAISRSKHVRSKYEWCLWQYLTRVVKETTGTETTIVDLKAITDVEISEILVAIIEGGH